jgi:hypothetical protein
VTNQVARSYGPSLPDEDQKGRLKSILDIVLVVERSAADTQDHRSMSAYQFVERGLLALGNETFEQLAICGLAGLGEVTRAAQVAEENVHGGKLPGKALLLYSSKEASRVHHFGDFFPSFRQSPRKEWGQWL